MSKTTRASGPLLDPAVVFPDCSKTTTQLPDNATVIGLVKHLLRVGKGTKSEKEVIREVSKLVYSKWWHDTVYCHSLEGIVYKLTELYKQYKDGWLRIKQGRDKCGAALKYKELVENKNKLFDILRGKETALSEGLGG